jgi:hypothetical protein
MELLDKLSPEQLLGFSAVVLGTAVTIVFIVAIWHFQLKYLADETALKRERQQAELALKQELAKRNLPPGELRLVLDSLGLDGAEGDLSDEERAALIRNLVCCAKGAPAAAIEETAALVNTAGPTTRRAVAAALEELVEEEVHGEHVLATIRAMCRGKPAGMLADAQRG